jgi:SAM-dependent methyltransferase
MNSESITTATRKKKEEEEEEKRKNKSFTIPQVSIHRTDSFRKLLNNPELRQAFFEGFLVDIFSIMPSNQVHRLLIHAAWDNRNKCDDDIYASLLESITKQTSSPISQIRNLWLAVKQVSEQKKEITRETLSVLVRLGRIGHIHDYCSIGDHEKLILRLREQLGIKGKTWIVHDEEATQENMGAVLERGSLDGTQLGEYVRIDYNNIKSKGLEFAKIPDCSCDLVTMNQGLHHLPPKSIPDFLDSVHRILRPGAVFIIREHDLDSEGYLLPMIDCAHMVFNAVTGVSLQLEKSEIRGFRSVLEWRQIVEASGFKDTMIYEMQPDDPTVDIMMCFLKQPVKDYKPNLLESNVHTSLPMTPPSSPS